MDNVVKWFILALIFVFDPLAIILFISLNTLISKEQKDRELEEAQEDVKKAEEETSDMKRKLLEKYNSLKQTMKPIAPPNAQGKESDEVLTPVDEKKTEVVIPEQSEQVVTEQIQPQEVVETPIVEEVNVEEQKKEEVNSDPPAPTQASWGTANFRGSRNIQPPVKDANIKTY